MKINEIFYSLQGEGCYAGTPAVFVRFSGCNLMCHFCDTSHEAAMDMTEDEVVEHIAIYPARRVILTGGEPTLQLTASFIDKLHSRGYIIHVESNGTRVLPAAVDWFVCSPKGDPDDIVATDIDELKVIFDDENCDPDRYRCVAAKVYLVQPCDYKEQERNRRLRVAAVEFVKRNPDWRLSLQTHKIIDIP
ncbi:MAG: 7-carboxy-7-deazaguanine synthase QueE [Paramuribaculum sp.]|nr:7-carboxy-7-deazaguanine synthase QueE [Paramuribaculum sp.]